MSLVLPNGAYTPKMIRRRKRAGRYQIVQGIAIGTAAIAWRNGGTLCDFGASIGGYVAYFNAAGIRADGIDATPGIEELSGGLVKEADLSIQRFFGHKWDIGFSIEVGEHIPPAGAAAFVANVANHSRRAIVITWATPNVHGRHHVNPLDTDRVEELFAEHSFQLDRYYTDWLRGMCPRVIRRRLLVLARRGVTLK